MITTQKVNNIKGAWLTIRLIYWSLILVILCTNAKVEINHPVDSFNPWKILHA